MDIEKLLKKSDELVRHLKESGYNEDYIYTITHEIKWIKSHPDAGNSYEELAEIRQSQTKSRHMKRRYRMSYGVLMRFDEYGILPDRRKAKCPLVKRNAYSRLNPEFRNMMDVYRENELERGIKARTIKGNISAASRFLEEMQALGFNTLAEITEDGVMSFFTDEAGNLKLSHGYRKQISQVFKANVGVYTTEAMRILHLLPKTRNRRKNIQYLQPEEVEFIHKVFTSETGSLLTYRNKAIGALMFFVGLRACDVSSLKLNEINWDTDEINIVQNKTGVPLTLPISAVVGNALYDYITLERPQSDDEHVFLQESCPFDPISPSWVSLLSSKIYDAAGIRQNNGDRRGSHLFRYNAATTLISNGVVRPIVSATLGHEDPNSLDYYTFADITHLRECALSIDKFPISREVFKV